MLITIEYKKPRTYKLHKAVVGLSKTGLKGELEKILSDGGRVVRIYHERRDGIIEVENWIDVAELERLVRSIADVAKLEKVAVNVYYQKPRSDEIQIETYDHTSHKLEKEVQKVIDDRPYNLRIFCNSCDGMFLINSVENASDLAALIKAAGEVFVKRRMIKLGAIEQLHVKPGD